MLTSSTRFLAVSLIGAWALTLGAVPALAVAPPQRPDSTWVALGALPERIEGPVFALAVNPGDPSSVLVGTGSGAIYRSSDGGGSWTTVARGLGRGVQTIQFNPYRPGVAYAGTRADGLYRSADGGITWVKQASVPNTTVRSLAFARSVTLAGADGGLFSSRDGLSWTAFPTLAPLSLNAIAVPVVTDPTPRFLAGGDATRGGEALPLYLSPDAGATWTNIRSLGSSTIIGAAAAGSASKPDSKAVVIGTNVGAFLSGDGGGTWAQVAGLPAIDFTAASFLANHPERIYIASDGGGTESGGLWTTADSGQTFRSLASPVGSVTALALSADDLPYVYTATYRPIDHATMLWAYHDTGATANPPAGGVPPAVGLPVATSAVAAVRPWDWRRLAGGPEAPFLALGALSLLVLLSAVVLQVRSGHD